MGISTNRGLMVGLPYKEMQDLFTKAGRDDLDDLIDYGELDIGSIYYDSDREDNIVGKWLITTSSSIEISPEELEGAEIYKLRKQLVKDFPNVEFKLYLTLDIT